MCFDAKRYCVPLVFLALGTALSCSIKEDREVCPCFLTVVRPDSEAGSQGELFWHLAAGDYSKEGKIEEGEKEVCDIEVPRTVLRLIAVSGMPDGSFVDGGFRFEEGKNCPPVFYYKTELDTRRNSLRDTIRLHKNYCKINIEGDISHSFTYVLAGNSCGFDLDGNILQGSLRQPFRQEGDGFCCRVPRQGDSSLRLELYRGEALARSFPIGKIIEESGYDWTAEDLEDVDIRLDYQDTGVNFTVNGWEHEITFYYEF